MPKGISLHLGLNFVDPGHYSGWDGELLACEADALDMRAIAAAEGFSSQLLLTAEATRSRVLGTLSEAADILAPGDIFFLTYSGHGGQLPDRNGDETDTVDETWCLFDGEMVDDELYGVFRRFREGVRILVLSDSCHSGTVIKVAYYHGTIIPWSATPDSPFVRYRAMPLPVAQRTYRDHREFYDKILRSPGSGDSKAAAKAEVKASVLLISGCQDNQLSRDGAFNGRFTGELLNVWNNGMFHGSYREFASRIVKRMPPDQTPNYYVVGASNTGFEAGRPFTI